MPLITSSSDAVAVPATGLYIESGEGTLIYTAPDSAGDIEINLSNVELPIPLEGAASGVEIKMKNGWGAYATSLTSVDVPTFFHKGGDTIGSGSRTPQAGQGAAIIKVSDTEQHYVRLSRIAYPFDLTSANHESITVLGENSFLSY